MKNTRRVVAAENWMHDDRAGPTQPKLSAVFRIGKKRNLPCTGRRQCRDLSNCYGSRLPLGPPPRRDDFLKPNTFLA